jgi:histone deacetylase 1/2
MDDISYEYIFKKVIDNIMDKYRPEAIVLQCGTDSLSGDRLGCFNLSIKGHGNCVKYIKSLNLPLILLGGGGYTLRNVPRCWSYETGIALGIDLDDDIPKNDFSEYFYPEYKLHMPVTNMENVNSLEYLNNVLESIENNLKHLNLRSKDINVNQSIPNLNLMKEEISEIHQDYLDNNPDIRMEEEGNKYFKNYIEY